MIVETNEYLIDGDSIPDDPSVWNPPDNQCRHEDLTLRNANPSPCVKCGAIPSVYPEDGPAYCEECCPEHEYAYDRHRRHHHCNTCDAPAPPDYYRD